MRNVFLFKHIKNYFIFKSSNKDTDHEAKHFTLVGQGYYPCILVMTSNLKAGDGIHVVMSMDR